jgi:hypothetical protein
MRSATCFWLFKNGSLTAATQTILWRVMFFIAPGAASSAYLTVSETFRRIRAKAISLFFAVSQFFGGVIVPFLFGKLVGAAGRNPLLWGYAIGAVLMFVRGVTAFIYGVNAERQPLESVAKPLSACDLALASGGGGRLTGVLAAGVRRRSRAAAQRHQIQPPPALSGGRQAGMSAAPWRRAAMLLLTAGYPRASVGDCSTLSGWMPAPCWDGSCGRRFSSLSCSSR